eukprot:Hpha_TRINITY_DN16425_c0_g3::TRINITY_DN16425_c0_g3_i4::g.159469::m.159469
MERHRLTFQEPSLVPDVPHRPVVDLRGREKRRRLGVHRPHHPMHPLHVCPNSLLLRLTSLEDEPRVPHVVTHPRLVQQLVRKHPRVALEPPRHRAPEHLEEVGHESLSVVDALEGPPARVRHVTLRPPNELKQPPRPARLLRPVSGRGVSLPRDALVEGHRLRKVHTPQLRHIEHPGRGALPAQLGVEDVLVKVDYRHYTILPQLPHDPLHRVEVAGVWRAVRREEPRHHHAQTHCVHTHLVHCLDVVVGDLDVVRRFLLDKVRPPEDQTAVLPIPPHISYRVDVNTGHCTLRRPQGSHQRRCLPHPPSLALLAPPHSDTSEVSHKKVQK